MEKFITRRQYDLLVQYASAWIQHNWRRYSVRWSLGGVTLRGGRGDIENLDYQLQFVEQAHKTQMDVMWAGIKERSNG